jgi:hypothetical protein
MKILGVPESLATQYSPVHVIPEDEEGMIPCPGTNANIPAGRFTNEGDPIHAMVHEVPFHATA